MADWQPIETAPRDGARILVWPTRAFGQLFIEIGLRDFDGAWFTDDASPIDPPPTHWMPLPEPPAEARRG